MATATETRKTELATQPTRFKVAPISFEVSLEQINQLHAEYMSLMLTDLNDKQQFARIHEGSMKIGKLIRGVEKFGKEMRDEANQYAKDVIAAQRSLTDPLEVIRDHLEDEKAKVKREQERIAREVEEKRQAMIAERCRLIEETGKLISAIQVAAMTEEQFQAALADAQAAKQARDNQAAAEAAERERVAAEQKAEAERLAKEREAFEQRQRDAKTRTDRMQARIELLARTSFNHPYTGDQLADMEATRWEALHEQARQHKAASDRAAADAQAALDKQRQEQADAQAKIDAERKRIHDARCSELFKYEFPGQRYAVADNIDDATFANLLETAKQRRDQYDAEQKALLEKTAAEAVEKAKAEAIAEQDRIAVAEKAVADAAEAERVRRAALMPDHEKLLAYADAIEAIPVPEVSYNAAGAVSEVETASRECITTIRGICSDMIKGDAA